MTKIPLEPALRLGEFFDSPILVTRAAAQSLEPHIVSTLAENPEWIQLDFSGIQGMTPSFMDELLGLIEKQLSEGVSMGLSVIFLYPPTRLTSKFDAVARGRGLSILERPDRSWILRGAA